VVGLSGEGALTVAERAVELGFSTTVGVIHDGDGTLKPLSEKQIFHAVKKLGNKDHARLNWFQDSIAEASLTNGAAARAAIPHLRGGKVHWCRSSAVIRHPARGHTMETSSANKTEMVRAHLHHSVRTSRHPRQLARPQMSEARFGREEAEGKRAGRADGKFTVASCFNPTIICDPPATVFSNL
jgi:hypothetical protein